MFVVSVLCVVTIFHPYLVNLYQNHQFWIFQVDNMSSVKRNAFGHLRNQNIFLDFAVVAYLEFNLVLGTL